MCCVPALNVQAQRRSKRTRTTEREIGTDWQKTETDAARSNRLWEMMRTFKVGVYSMDPTQYAALGVALDWKPDISLWAPTDGRLAHLVHSVNENRRQECLAGGLPMSHYADEQEVHEQLPVALHTQDKFTFPQVQTLLQVGMKIELAKQTDSSYCAVDIMNFSDPTIADIDGRSDYGTHWVTVFVTKAAGSASHISVAIVDTCYDPPGAACRKLLRWSRELGSQTVYCSMQAGDKQESATCGYQAAGIFGHVFRTPQDFFDHANTRSRLIDLLGSEI